MKVLLPLMRFFLVVFLLPALSFAAAEEGAPLRILVLGDSLTAGYGLTVGEAFPARLEQALQQSGHDVEVLNGGVSGDTSAGGLARLEWALGDDPHLVILELGGNDALRGLPPEQTRQNLDAIITRLKQAGVAVLLTGMHAPRNLGPEYYSKFDRLYPELAARNDIAFYPFFLEGVAANSRYNLDDGIHPNADGVGVIVCNILPTVERLLEQLTTP